MRYELLHIYGPFSIHSYGLSVALGLLITITLMKQDRRFIELNLNKHLVDIITIGIFAGLFGGRLFYFLSGEAEYSSLADFFMLWQGGLSILGCIIGIGLVLPVYVHSLGIPIIPVADLFGIYTPLLQSIARIGCFFAGCCYGKISSVPWAVMYTDAKSIAPLYTLIHPTQLYSALLSFFIFLLLYYVIEPRVHVPGALFALFLMFVAAERFIIDFWRDDQLFTLAWMPYISFHQFIALIIFIIGLIGYIIVYRITNKKLIS